MLTLPERLRSGFEDHTVEKIRVLYIRGINFSTRRLALLLIHLANLEGVFFLRSHDVDHHALALLLVVSVAALLSAAGGAVSGAWLKSEFKRFLHHVASHI